MAPRSQHISPARPVVAALLVTGVLAGCGTGAPGPPPPETRRDDTVETLHGVAVADPYRWLEERQSDATGEWLARQQVYTRRVLRQAPPADATRRRLQQLYAVDAVSAPRARAGRTFFARRAVDKDLAALYVRRAGDTDDEVLVDPQGLSPDGSRSVSWLDVSTDGTLAAFAVRRGEEDEVEVRFVDADAGEQLTDVLARGRYFNVSITADRSGVFYDRLADDGPRIFRHAFGQPQEADRLVFGAGHGADEIITSRLSSSGRYLLINVAHGAAASRNELYFRDNWTGAQVHPIVTDIEAAFSAHIGGDTLFVLTDWQAPRGRVFAANLRDPSPDSWALIVPQGDAVIEDFAAVGGRLILRRLQDVRPRLTVYEPDGFPVREVEIPAIGALSGLGGGTWESDEAFFTFSSLARPPTVYRYRVSDGEQQPWAAREAPAEAEDFEEDFEVKQVQYRSGDGTEVPMFVAHHRGLARNGTNRTLLTGYGGFGVSLLPGFDPRAVAWMEQGGVWAVANLRGGGERGQEWHRAGMLAAKQNAFDDFTAAAEWLIANDYTRAEHLAIMGDSNGGLLVGAALTQRPDLFAAVVCAYPLLDMLRYHRFGTAGYWVPEYGSAEDPQQFEYLAAYSPYHHVERGTRYPAVMLVSGDADTRVAPLHARKMAALLQAETGSAEPVILLYDPASGDAAGRPVSAAIEELTTELRFLLWKTR